MKGMEAAIRGALERAGIPGAQARARIYESARTALDRSLERQGVSDPERIAVHRGRLNELIAGIEAEWTPPSGDAPAPGPAAIPGGGEIPSPHGPAAAAPPMGSPPPIVATPRPEPGSAPNVGGEARLDFAPDAGGHATTLTPEPVVAPPPQARTHPRTPAPEPRLGVDPGSAPRPEPRAESSPAAAAPAPGKPARKVKVPKPRPEKRRRPIFASIFSGAVMLSFLGIGIWWLIESGALTTAEQRDTGVPNPPPSLTRDDFAGGPQQLNPGSGFSGEWANVYTPGRDGAPVVSGNASAQVIEQPDGNVLRIQSGSGAENGEVRIPLGVDVMQALAGRQSALALSVRSASSDTTQIYVRCEFSVLGDCGRRRFDVTYETSDILFSLDYDRALAPNEPGSLVINSDISGGGKGIDLLAVRIRPTN